MREKISSPTLGNENVPDEMTIITVLMPKLANPGRRGVIEDARAPRLPTREVRAVPFYRRAAEDFLTSRTASLQGPLRIFVVIPRSRRLSMNVPV